MIEVEAAIASDACVPFIMNDGPIGYAPVNCHVGDVICQFSNCNISLVLRKGPEKLVILGRCCLTKHTLQPSRLGEPESHAIHETKSSNKSKPAKNLDLYLDILTLQQLTGTTEKDIPNPLAGRSCIRFVDTSDATKIQVVIQ